MMSIRRQRLNASGLSVILIVLCLPLQADDLGDAVRAAVKKVDPGVVRLRVIGGEQSVDGDKVTSLVTTGVVISAEGEILTSQFALRGKPEAVLAEDASGHRTSVEIVATDYVRRLVLLKAKEGQWVPATVAPRDSVQIGQWSVALGRFYTAESSNVSVGVISALNRIYGTAIQTDAKISPVNYGGPLINLQGLVMGILVPLSPRGQGNATTGIEWYDSGIGFGIPMDDALKAAERLRAGRDLKAGRLGVKLSTSGIFSSDLSVQRVVAGGPADLAGLKPGDQLRQINDRVIERIGVLEEVVAASYAGDSVTIGVKRGAEDLSLTVTLADELPEVSHASLGFMMVRTSKIRGSKAAVTNRDIDRIAEGLPDLEKQAEPKPPANEPTMDEPPVEDSDSVELVVINESPAATAGLPPRVELISINGFQTKGPAELSEAVSEIQPGAAVKVEYRIPDQTEIKSGEINAAPRSDRIIRLSEPVLNAVAESGRKTAPEVAADQKAADAAGQIQKDEPQPASGDIQRREQSFEERGRCVIFSSSATTEVLPGLVLLLSSEGESEEQILLRWKPFLESHKLIVVIPLNPEKSRLSADDIPLVMSAVQDLASGGKADMRRIVVVGNREQSRLAWQLVFGGPSPIQGIALTDGWISSAQLEGAEGAGRSVLLLQTSGNAQATTLLNQSCESLRKAGFWAARPTDNAVEQTVADWSLLLGSF